MITLVEFHSVLDSARGYPLNDHQRESVDFGAGPLWIIAGPGSGKSEVLVTRALKLICVDGAEPRSVLMTTFTKKAARNLEDRLAAYLMALQTARPELSSVDLSEMRIGTLHSLCNDILQEFRYPGYQNVRLLEDVEQHMFVYRHAEIVNCTDMGFWSQVDYAIQRFSPNYLPNKWARAKAAVTLCNHIVEDLVDLDTMRAAGDAWAALADYYEQYRDELANRYRCDYAHLQLRFYDFLQVPMGQELLQGVPDKHPSLSHILVDEYQDTNPVQERIYLGLAGQGPHNLTVVGDDDQALYRFRGGTVACMVNFDKACQASWGIDPTSKQLIENYRSHRQIVGFFNDYITSFPEMNEPGVRAPNKLPVVAMADRSEDHPGLGWVSTARAGDLADAVARFIQEDLIDDGVISDLNQCVILLRSAKDSPRNAGPFLRALEARGIPIYNPRSKAFLEAQEVQCMLGALICVLDPAGTYRTATNPGGRAPSWQDAVIGWEDALRALLDDAAVDTDGLQEYLRASVSELQALCAKRPSDFLGLGITEIIFRILSLEPFRTWRQDPNRNARISKVTRLFESYRSFNLDTLRSDAAGTGLDPIFLNRLYWMFFGYLIVTGVDDDEDDEVIVPSGYLPVMTIHQSKGLEFPFVIVDQLGQSWGAGAAQILEGELAPFRQDLYSRGGRDPDLLSLEDDIRLMYVAYSRAEYGLILAGTQAHVKRHVAAPGRDFTAFRRRLPAI